MLTCHQVTEQSTALLEGALSLRKRMAMRMHLVMCVHCRRFNRQLRSLVESLHSRRRLEPVTDEFVDRAVTAVGNAQRNASGSKQPEP